MTALFAAIYSYQKKEWTWGSFFISCGVAIKMNMILVIPAVGLILYQALGFSDLMMQASVMFQVQVSSRSIRPVFWRLTRAALARPAVSSRQLERVSYEGL